MLFLLYNYFVPTRTFDSLPHLNVEKAGYMNLLKVWASYTLDGSYKKDIDTAIISLILRHWRIAYFGIYYYAMCHPNRQTLFGPAYLLVYSFTCSLVIRRTVPNVKSTLSTVIALSIIHILSIYMESDFNYRYNSYNKHFDTLLRNYNTGQLVTFHVQVW